MSLKNKKRLPRPMGKCVACAKTKALSNWFVGERLFTDLCGDCFRFGYVVFDLGLSIHNFARRMERSRVLREEINQLKTVALRRTSHAEECCYGLRSAHCDCGVSEVRAALDRLGRLALEAAEWPR